MILQVAHHSGCRTSAPYKLVTSCAAGSISKPTPPAPADNNCLLPPAPDTKGIAPQRRWNAVCLAFLGDGIWEAALRQHFYNPASVKQYNSTVTTLANTQAQATCYQLLLDEGWVSDQEAGLMRWAANSTSVAPPSHATRQQYKQATAVETLVAHLYLTDSTRLGQLLDWLLHPQQLAKWQQPVPVHGHHAEQAVKRQLHSGTQAATSSGRSSSSRREALPKQSRPNV